jgi:hypothetical protein
MTPKIAAFSFVALFVPMSLSVADRPQGCADDVGSRQFMRIDANKDGRVTEHEAFTADMPLFRRVDVDGDGAVTNAEFLSVTQGRNPDRAQRLFEWLDGNRDGRVTMDEVTRSAWRCCEASTGMVTGRRRWPK